MRPVILITTCYADKGEAYGKRAVSVCNCDYTNAIELAGGVPLLLPNIDSADNMEALVSLADGIIFSGGGDVHPKYFNEEVKADNLNICDRRDRFEMQLALRVLPVDMPVLGICRGMQLLNIAAGGNIYQDIGLQYETAIRHNSPGENMHKIRLAEGTRLYDMFGEASARVNSYHHQSVKDLAPAFKASAYSEDGLLEAFEMDGDRFLMGLQWHPEMLIERHPEEFEIFKSFIDSAGKYKAYKKRARGNRQ